MDIRKGHVLLLEKSTKTTIMTMMMLVVIGGTTVCVVVEVVWMGLILKVHKCGLRAKRE
jgi:hypothetical protein